MLSLQLKSGEYLTIGNDIVVQVFRDGPGSRVSVKAPRELPILRGELLERTEERPDGLHAKRPKSRSERVHDARQKEKLAAKKERYEAERRREAGEKTAFVQELMDIAEHMDELVAAHGGLGVQGKLDELRARLSSIAESTAQDAGKARRG